METPLAEKNGLYVVPLHLKPPRSKVKVSTHIAYGFVEAMFIGFMLLPGDDRTKFIFNIFFLCFGIFFGYLWVALAFFNKSYLIVTDESLEYKWLFGHQKIPLNSIYKAEFLSEGGAIKLGIWASGHKGKQSFWEITDRLFGRDYTVGIVVSAFPDIDFEKLRLTILSKAGI